MAQQQLTKQKREQTEEVVEETTADTTRTEEVVAECDSCLSNIDDILAEVAETDVPDLELTDEDIYSMGHPDPQDYRDPETGEYDWESYIAAKDRYVKAYENITGMSYDDTEEQVEEHRAVTGYSSDWGSCTC